MSLGKSAFAMTLTLMIGLNSMSLARYEKWEQAQGENNGGGETIVEKYTREELSFGIEGFEVQGELIKPTEQKEPLKLAIIVGGSGSTNRDASVVGAEIYPYRDIAEGLAEKGIATFRYDKRAYSHRDKLLNEEAILNVTLKEEYLEDYNEIIKYFSNQDYIKKDSIYVIGHSQGGYIIPLLEKTNPKAAKYISLAGCTLNLRELMIEQLQDIIDNFDLSEIEKEEYLYGIKELKRAGELTSDSPDEIIQGVGTKYWLEINNYNTLEEFKNTNKPILFLQGLNDWNVREKEVIAFENVLSDREDTEFKRYEGLNHYFMKGTSIKENVEQVVIDDIAKFINK